jgi:hypothetical protein
MAVLISAAIERNSLRTSHRDRLAGAVYCIWADGISVWSASIPLYPQDRNTSGTKAER